MRRKNKNVDVLPNDIVVDRKLHRFVSLLRRVEGKKNTSIDKNLVLRNYYHYNFFIKLIKLKYYYNFFKRFQLNTTYYIPSSLMCKQTYELDIALFNYLSFINNQVCWVNNYNKKRYYNSKLFFKLHYIAVKSGTHVTLFKDLVLSKDIQKTYFIFKKNLEIDFFFNFNYFLFFNIFLLNLKEIYIIFTLFFYLKINK